MNNLYLINDINVSLNIMNISLENLNNGLLNKRYIMDLDNVVYTTTKSEAEVFIIAFIRKLSSLTLRLIYCGDTKGIYNIINESTNLVTLMLYLQGVFPTRPCTIKEILNELSSNDRTLLKPASFTVKLKKDSVTNLTYHGASPRGFTGRNYNVLRASN